MFKHIIVPVDESTRSLSAVPVASQLAEQFSVDTQLLSVISPKDKPEARETKIKSKMADLGLTPAAVEVKQSMSVIDTLLAVFSRQDEPLMVMSTHARNPIHEIAVGSVASAVLLQSRRPMMFVGPRFAVHWRGPIRHLVVPFDGSEFSEASVSLAADWAQQADLPMVLVQVLDPSQAGAAGSDVLEWGSLKRKANELCDQGLKVSYEVLHGSDVAGAISHFVDTVKSPLVVMSTRGASGLDRLKIGSVAKSLLEEVSAPVLLKAPN
ncbi:Nucleotide-binding universal stress protein, UspA family [Ectothiorhodosinus mongolicus]|uniref:Nucleotide-binding universal stress protein, UspA family n=1 Tax=Ectothiorhodosinus mongolicus TaxID=233100 RepID=A0A1R3W7L7_9GAMM|nr:universal stress protein [Ectothiorhodosinus mongolicus]ULX57567.1 universal stress protein [Ectothiorhodosinus mongolicus]SIT72841.1 Nucleotide-binding universal stress protein, UspA family [Ectothiorhodosinus mongolicus]